MLKVSTVICTVVNGTRQGIVLYPREMYTNFDGSSGMGDTLAKAIFTDLENHVGLKDKLLLQVQGRVMDGQYVNEPFIPEPTARSAVRRGLLIPHGYLHPGKSKHSEV